MESGMVPAGPGRPPHASTTNRREDAMPQYLYQVAYTPESLAAKIKNLQDRLEVVSKQVTEAVGARIVAGGYSYGEYDVSAIVATGSSGSGAAGPTGVPA